MAESYSPRMGARLWTDDGDTFTRDELHQTHVNLEARAAIFENGTLAARPAAGVIGRFYVLDSTEPDAALRGQTYYDTGAAWIMQKFDLTASLATKANVAHSHALAELPVANSNEVSTTKLVRADDARLVTEWAPGDIIMSGAADRVGFVLCNGNQYNVNDQPGLFNKIGYTFGGAGEFFNVPDIRDRFPVGASANKARGAVGGSATKTLTTANMPQHSHTMNHTHTITDPGHAHNNQVSAEMSNQPYSSVGGVGISAYFGGGLTHTGYAGIINLSNAAAATGVSVNTHNGSTGNVGGSTAFDIMPPWAAINFFIKL